MKLTEQLEVLAVQLPDHATMLRSAAKVLTAIAWDRTPGYPPVPVLQPRYDALVARVEELEKLTAPVESGPPAQLDWLSIAGTLCMKYEIDDGERQVLPGELAEVLQELAALSSSPEEKKS